MRPPGVEGEKPWWSRGDEREALIHEEVCGDPGFCSKCPGLGEWSQQFISAGEMFDSGSFPFCAVMKTNE